MCVEDSFSQIQSQILCDNQKYVSPVDQSSKWIHPNMVHMVFTALTVPSKYGTVFISNQGKVFL